MKAEEESKRVITVQTPIDEQVIGDLRIGDQIEIHGVIYCGRDAVLPKLVELIEKGTLDSIHVNLQGAVIFHTAHPVVEVLQPPRRAQPTAWTSTPCSDCLAAAGVPGASPGCAIQAKRP